MTGSSPLTRGTPKYVAEFKMSARFIPAYAGNSLKPSSRPGDRAVHPRLRGELTPIFVFTISLIGSSPLTRGTQEITNE